MNNYEKMLDELLDYEGDVLTAWEVEFVDSIDKQRRSARGGAMGWNPSTKQQNIIHELWSKL